MLAFERRNELTRRETAARPADPPVVYPPLSLILPLFQTDIDRVQAERCPQFCRAQGARCARDS
jgi:hypothetical protein